MGRRATGTVEPLKTSIRLKFTWRGARCVETLELAPTPANIKAAERLMAQVQAAIGAGVYDRANFFEPEPDGQALESAGGKSFGECADTWFSGLTGAKSTRTGYGTSMRFWKTAFEGKAIGDVRHSDLKAAVAAKTKTGVSGKTINNHLIVVRGIFEQAVEDELITKDPTDKIKSAKHQPPPPDPFDRDEMEAILAHMAKHYPEPVLNYFEFAFCTGLRPSEEIIARWGKTDWRKQSLLVDAANVLWEEKDTKTHSVREVDLSDRAIEVLKRQKAFTFMRGPDEPIFCNPVKMRSWADEQRQRRAYFQPTLRSLGIRMRDAYNTRHTYATLALMGDCNVLYVARQLGHVDATMLLKRYAKWIDQADKGAQAKKLNGILSRNRPRAVEEA